MQHPLIVLEDLSCNYLQFTGVTCIMIYVCVNYHWAQMTSGVFMLVVIGYLSVIN